MLQEQFVAMFKFAILLQMFTFYVFGFMNPDVWNRPQHECFAKDDSKLIQADSDSFEHINVTRQFLDYFKGIFWMTVVKFIFMMPSFVMKARGAFRSLSLGIWSEKCCWLASVM